MLKLVLYAAGVLAVLFGIEDLYHAAISRTQAATTCEQLVRQQPRTLWLRVRGCELDYMSAGFRESGGRVAELVFPVRPAGRPRGEPAAIVATSHDPAVLAIAQETIGKERQPDQEAFLVMMLRIVTTLHASREIEGVARAGLLQQLRTRRLLAGLPVPLATRVVVVDLHDRPDVVKPAVLSGAGAIALLAAVMLTLQSRRAAAALHRAEVPPSEAPPVTAEAPRVRVLLLKLPGSADRNAIEHAPPLGDVETVRATIAACLPEVLFDAANRASAGSNGGTLTIDLGTQNLVHTAVVDARGAAALAKIRQLLDATGWRAYGPKEGTFVDLPEKVSG